MYRVGPFEKYVPDKGVLSETWPFGIGNRGA